MTIANQAAQDPSARPVPAAANAGAAPVTGAAIRHAWDELIQAEPKLRPVDIAQRLGVSEGALVASRCGIDTWRLEPPFGRLLERLPTVGQVMVLTRNRSVVHEKVGRFDHVSIGNPHGIVLNHDIDLRLFMNHWRHGYAIEQPQPDGSVRRTFQFFDEAGQAVHKVFARPETDIAAWDALRSELTASEQSDTVAFAAVVEPRADRADSEIDVAALQAGWAAMQDTHEFFGLLRQHGVGRQQALRLVGKRFAEPAGRASTRQMLERASADQLPIMCFVGNPGCIQIHTGPVQRIHVMGPWLNVLDPGFNLYLREDHIEDAWIVRKPTSDGDVTSLELFDADGRNMAMFFGERKPGKPELSQWRVLADSLVA